MHRVVQSILTIGLAISSGLLCADEPAAATWPHFRVTWVQDHSAGRRDVNAEGNSLKLMAFDSADGQGERAVLGTPGSYARPLLTPDGRRIVYSSHVDHSVWWVDFAGGSAQKLAPGFALDVWQDPVNRATWVYLADWVGKPESFRLRNVRRIRLDDVQSEEVVWNETQISPDNFQLSLSGRQAAGEFPWPSGGVADLTTGKWIRRGTGCWASMAPDDSGVSWVFDGPHRNLQMFAPGIERGWSVPVNTAPEFAGHEVFHPRWSNHTQYFALTGPYRVNGPINTISGGGPDVEIQLGRFSSDMTKVSAWYRVTRNDLGDFFPDAWFEGGETSVIDPAGLKSLAAAVAARPVQQVRVKLKCAEARRIPAARSILPYRSALVVHKYDVLSVEEGELAEQQILVAHWGIRDGTAQPSARVRPGQTLTLTVESFEEHRELRGERQIMDGAWTGIPLFYIVSGKK
ncbi:MAG: TolB family protein [Planctomyces sp.]